MSASPAGLPYAMHRIPVEISRDMGGHPRMNRLDEHLEVLDARVGKHPVPEVEDMARSTTRPPQHLTGAFPDQVRRSEEDRGVEVALDTSLMADPAPALVERHPPVQRHDVGTRLRDR